ncbi:ParA family protein [Lacticaseibacillus pantheris]|nr:AAA family ATPase [Lacticaseibacillus pantheris]
MAGKVISFINMKGGVAKTTLTKEIGILLSSDKYNKKKYC